MRAPQETQELRPNPESVRENLEPEAESSGIFQDTKLVTTESVTPPPRRRAASPIWTPGGAGSTSVRACSELVFRPGR